MSSPHAPVVLAVALEGAGWHPAARREHGARPGELTDLVAEAWAGAGLTGFRPQTAVLPYGLERVTRELVPEPRRRSPTR